MVTPLRRSAACIPECVAWVKTASTDAATGKAANIPLNVGPSILANLVIIMTNNMAASMRTMSSFLVIDNVIVLCVIVGVNFRSNAINKTTKSIDNCGGRDR